VTCSATEFDVFDEIGCSLLILDEASQMTEPMSLLPITRFKCERALFVGDPLQLQVWGCWFNCVAYAYVENKDQAGTWVRMDHV
jgi:hypothetical protein